MMQVLSNSLRYFKETAGQQNTKEILSKAMCLLMGNIIKKIWNEHFLRTLYAMDDETHTQKMLHAA